MLNPKHEGTFAGTNYAIYHGTAGSGLPMHEHNFPHTHACMVGKTQIRKHGKVIDMTPESRPVVLAANEPHEIECMENGTVFENLSIIQ